MTTTLKKEIYSEGYHEGYTEGYAEGYDEAKEYFSKMNKKHPLVVNKKPSITLDDYTKAVIGVNDIKHFLKDKSIERCNSFDILYSPKSGKESWRIGCRLNSLSKNNVNVRYYSPQEGVEVFRTFRITNIKMIHNNKDEIVNALKNFEDFHNMMEGSATIQEVKKSSAGIFGWFNSVAPTVKDDLVEKMDNLTFNIGQNNYASKKRRT